MTGCCSRGRAWVTVATGVAVVVALAVAPAPARADASADVPKRTLWDLHLGIGYFNMAAASGSTTAEFLGPAFEFGVAGGLRIAKPIGLFGELGFTGSPAYYVENGASKNIGSIVWTNFTLSAGAVYWIRPRNVFVAGAATLCRFRIQRKDSQVALAESTFGPGAFLEVGKQWSGPLGVSTGLRFFYGSAVQLDRDFRWRTYSIMLTLRAGYSPFWTAPTPSI